jgi:hypothetical protein
VTIDCGVQIIPFSRFRGKRMNILFNSNVEGFCLLLSFGVYGEVNGWASNSLKRIAKNTPHTLSLT